MYFDGCLQDGIAFALEQHKVVVCFVTEANEQSTLWEHEYMKDEEISDQLKAGAVVLRLEQGSQEAGFLTAFYPVQTSPAVIVINNGQLIADIHGDHSLDSFKEKLLLALDPESLKDKAAPRSLATDTEAFEAGTEIVPDVGRSEVHQPVDPAIQSLLEERRERLEIDQMHKNAAEEAQSLAKQEARRAEAEAAAPDSARAKQATYAQQQRRKQREIRQERERILKVIENDKMERKHKGDLRKAFLEAGKGGDDRAEGLVDQQIFSEISPSRSKTLPDCALQVRLFDGTTIRSRFSPKQSLRGNVRRWIDEQRTDDDAPYTFRQVLAPKPNHTISISEEEQSLQSLGLTPSATLIMVRVQGYTAAYAANGGYLSKGLADGFNMISGGVNWLTGVMGTILGTGSAGPSSPGSRRTTDGTHVPSTSAINIRTLGDQQKNKDSQQFYNGNQVGGVAIVNANTITNACKLNFEPRRDEDSNNDQI
ncbi:hypothetical protein MMC11_007119 [Xylographa trunciseda]|nr:hypothetical protein [Xylographa trunciseda]